MPCENCKDGKEVRRRWMTRMTKILILVMMYRFKNSLDLNLSSWITYVPEFLIAALQLDHMSNSICTSSFLPVLNDRKVVVHLSLGNQTVTRASWRVIHQFRDHLLNSSLASRSPAYMCCIDAWTFLCETIACFSLIDHEMKYISIVIFTTSILISRWIVDPKDDDPTDHEV